MKMMHGRWTMTWLLSVLVVAVWLAAGCLAQAQTLTSVAASNVTAWSAALHGSYGGLATGRSYEVYFYYGLTDAGTNHAAWSNSSSGVTIAPADTNEASGVYSRTVVELTAGTQYWYRAAAIDLDSFDLLMATQSLTFTTRGSSPTEMPQVIYMTVVVDTNGVLRFPTNFFLANGIVPTSGVEQLFIRMGSNEASILTLSTQMVPRTGAGFLPSNLINNVFYPRSNPSNFVIQGQAMSSSSFSGNGALIEDLNANNVSNLADLVIMKGATGQQVYADNTVLNWGSLLTLLAPFGSPGPGEPNPNNVLLNLRHATQNYEGRFEPIYLLIEHQHHEFATNRTPVFRITTADYNGNNQSVVFDVWTNRFDFRGRVIANANGIGVTNIPLSGLRLSNAYTGGVMRLVTTDGVNFFLQ